MPLSRDDLRNPVSLPRLIMKIGSNAQIPAGASASPSLLLIRQTSALSPSRSRTSGA